MHKLDPVRASLTAVAEVIPAFEANDFIGNRWYRTMIGGCRPLKTDYLL